MSESYSDHTTVCGVDYHRLVSVLLFVGAATVIHEESGRDGWCPRGLSRTICQWQTCCQDRKAA